MNSMMKTVGGPIVPNNMPQHYNSGPVMGMGGPMGGPTGPSDPGMNVAPRKRFYGHRRLNNPMREYTLRSANLPLEDAAKLEMSRATTAEHNKTAVNILQEVLSRRSIIPTYEVLPVEGTLNDPLYQYKLTLESDTKKYVGIGGGRSKKEAKQNTAKSVLNQLLGVKDDTPPPIRTNKGEQNGLSNGTSKTSAPKLAEPNPISLLQESCFSRRWPPPYYETDSPNGMPHERLYTTTVYVDKFREAATAKTKKMAKREAANRMLSIVKGLPQTPFDYKKLYEETSQSINLELENEMRHLKETTYAKMTPQQSKKIAQFHQKLKNNKGSKLEALKQNISNQKGFDPVQYLHEISQEQRFEITFVEIEDKSLSGHFQALVQLATYPVAVCHGQGKSQQDAKTVAAHNAIEYLRLMTKSSK